MFLMKVKVTASGSGHTDIINTSGHWWSVFILSIYFVPAHQSILIFPAMGIFGSKHAKTPEPELLDTPWREINWRDKQGPLQVVNNYRPRTEGLQLRILLHGLIGVGKSSFINSVSTVLQGDMSRIAVVGNSGESVTKEYKTHRIQKGNQNDFYPFVLNDIMGMQNATRRNRRVHVKDVKRAMKGHVRDGYTFNPERNILKGGQFYNRNPTANDKVHVLVSVIDADKVRLIEKEVQETLQDIREEAIDLGIPQVAILTKIDTVCPEIKEDIKNVYRSRTLKKKMEELSASVGIPMNCIFPVKNYHEELQLNNDIDVLILNALTNIIKVGEELLNQNNPS